MVFNLLIENETNNKEMNRKKCTCVKQIYIYIVLYIFQGDYTIQATVLQPSTGIQLGCFSFDATLKRKTTGHSGGWLLGRRRRSN